MLNLSDVQNYFYNKKVQSVLCLKAKQIMWVDYNDAFNWYSTSETDYDTGEVNGYVIVNGVYMANLDKGELATIINSEKDLEQPMSNGIHSVAFDGTYLNFSDINGSPLHSVPLDSVVSPQLMTVEGSVNDLNTMAYNHESEIGRLRKLVEDLQPKRKRLTFAKQSKYKLK